MTEEQLNKEAEEYAISVMKFKEWTEDETKTLIKADYIAGYRSRDKKFEEMEAVLKEVADHLKDSRWSPEEDLYAKIIKVLGLRVDD